MAYLPTAQTVARLLEKHPIVSQCWMAAVKADEDIVICPVVEFSLRRALLVRQAHRQLTFLEHLLTQYTRPAFTSTDWIYASQLWADGQTQGIQLSDAEVLMVAQATRLDAVLVTTQPIQLTSLNILQVNWERVDAKRHHPESINDS